MASSRVVHRVDSRGVRILHVDERRATEPGYGVHWMSDLVVRSVPELSSERGYGGALGVREADVALVEISDRPSASVVPMVERLRSQGVPVAVRLHRSFCIGASSGENAPLGAALETAIARADLALFRGRGELVRVASELSVAPAKARLLPSPVHLPAELGSTHDGGVIGIGFAEGALPPDVRAIDSVGDLRVQVMACTAVALGPLMGPGYPALTHGLIARGINVVAARAQAAIDGHPPQGLTRISPGANRGEWAEALAGMRGQGSRHVPKSDRPADRWFECLGELAGRELLTRGT